MKKLLPILFIMLFIGGCTFSDKRELSDTQFLMDTVCTIRIGGANQNVLKEAIDAAFDKAYEVASDTDYYSASSDVSKINQAKANQSIAVSPHTAAILSTALDICEKSDGAFDITIAPLKDIWGFNIGDHTPPSEIEIYNAVSAVNYKNVIINKSNNTVTKLEDNTKIDLGGCAKGYAADCVLDVLKSYDIGYALIDFGGNIITYGENPSRKDHLWIVGIKKPYSQNGEYLKTVTVSNSAVVTSGTYQRYFKWNNKKYHHILNTKNGYPTDNGITSVSIIHPSALVADCLSTACIALGEDKSSSLTTDFKAEAVFIYTE